MTHETLSALLDGECSPAELDRLLDEMDRDPRLKDQYSRLCLVREVRHGTRLTSANLDFSAQVLRRLDSEPASQPDSNVVPFRPRKFAAWRPLAGLAAAAGLAAVVVLAVKPQPNAEPLASPQTPAASSDAAASPEEVADAGDPRWAQLDRDNADQLNTYLIAYTQSRAQQGVGGTLGYARFAAHTAEYRPQRIQGPRAQTVDDR